MKLTREVKTAILVIGGIIAFIYGFNYLKGINLFEDNNEYYTEFEYNALELSAPVTIKGNAVGKITDIKYNFETGKTRVAFTVNESLKFSKNSKIRLYETGLMGGNAIAIIASNNGEQAKPGDILKSEVQKGLINSLSENFSGVSTNLDTTLKTADTLLLSLNNLVKDDSNKGLKATIAELNSTLKSFKTLSYNLNNTVAKNQQNLETVLTNFKTLSNDLTQLSSELKSAGLGNAVTKLDNTLASTNLLMQSINNGKGTLGKLAKDDALYNNIEGATKELEALLRDIKLHPKRYFRILSKKEIPYKEE